MFPLLRRMGDRFLTTGEGSYRYGEEENYNESYSVGYLTGIGGISVNSQLSICTDTKNI